MKKIDLWLATHNQNKIKEFKNLLIDLPFHLKTLNDLPMEYKSPAEIGQTFEENAQIKLTSFQDQFSKKLFLVEDSGFEVNCLGGRPGIHSARYREDKSMKERLELLIEEVNQTGSDDLSVRMVSVIQMCIPNSSQSTILGATGIIKGTLSKEVKGDNGFAYDHIFIPEGETRTIAEIGYPEKNKFSHRFCSVQFLKKQLEPYLIKIQNLVD